MQNEINLDSRKKTASHRDLPIVSGSGRGNAPSGLTPDQTK